jgi:hypothetical protein
MARSVNMGNAGEHLVMAELLARGHHVAMADRGNPAFDILTLIDGVYSSLRVKTTTGEHLQWSVKKDGSVFLDLDSRKNPRDFVVLVQMVGGPRNAVLYVVPTKIVEGALRKTYAYWMKFPKRDGSPRKVSSHRGLGLAGRDTETNISAGFATKWAKYREAWHLLEKDGPP